jgi:hypothetical protein
MKEGKGMAGRRGERRNVFNVGKWRREGCTMGGGEEGGEGRGE